MKCLKSRAVTFACCPPGDSSLIEPVDCPNCFARVVILSDDVCPRCRKSRRDVPESNRNLQVVWIADRDLLPGCCVRCGVAAHNKVSVEHIESWTPIGDDGPSLGYRSLILMILDGVFRWCWQEVRRLVGGRAAVEKNSLTIAIKVPVCDACRGAVIEPLAADVRSNSLKLAVHRDFAMNHEKLISHQ